MQQIGRLDFIMGKVALAVGTVSPVSPGHSLSRFSFFSRSQSASFMGTERLFSRSSSAELKTKVTDADSDLFIRSQSVFL